MTKRKGRQGRHQSTSKEGEATLKFLRAIPGVEGVIIGRTTGRKSISRGAAVGYLKLQREDDGGFKAALQASYGLQEIYISISSGQKESVRAAIIKKYPS